MAEWPKECCGTCRFGYMPEYFRGDQAVLCRRRSPVVDGDVRNNFPVTHALQWCGEFEPKEEQQ
jgi:hypothetical protein